LLQLIKRDADAIKRDLKNYHGKGVRPQRHKNGEISQKSGDLVRFLLQTTRIHPNFEKKSEKISKIAIG